MISASLSSLVVRARSGIAEENSRFPMVVFRVTAIVVAFCFGVVAKLVSIVPPLKDNKSHL